VLAPVVDYQKPFTLLIGFDTHLPLPMTAVMKLMAFMQAEDWQHSTPYSQAWARPLPRDAWSYISHKLRANICENSHVTF
jgi:hypothetical protein